MSVLTNHLNILDNQLKNKELKLDSIKILSEFTRKDIEKSYNLDTIRGTEAYYSARYGWTLRKTED